MLARYRVVYAVRTIGVPSGDTLDFEITRQNDPDAVARLISDPLPYCNEIFSWDVIAKGIFGGHTTQAMKDKFGITQSRPLADFLPTLTIAAKNLATEMTNHNVQQADLQGEQSITREHVQNNSSVRQMLGERGIEPESLPQEEDIKKLERRVKSEEKKLEKKAGRLPQAGEKP